MTQRKFIERLIFIGKLIYWKTPGRLNFIYFPAEFILKLSRCVRMDLWYLSGAELSSHHELEIRYAGTAENKNYLATMAFQSGYREQYLGKRWIWQIASESPGEKPGYPLRIVEVHGIFRKLFQNKRCFWVPSWLLGEIEIPDNIPAFVQREKNLRYNINKVSRNRFYPEVTDETSRIYRFYNEMHVPYITKMHDKKAIIVDFRTIKRKTRKCDLVLVKKEGEDIAGGLLAYQRNRASCVILGVKDGNVEYVRNGALYALYYFAFSYLRRKGYKSVDMGTSRAFLKDGALKYKKMWNYRIVGKSPVNLMIQVVNLTEGARAFLQNNPFISADKNGYISSVFADPDPLSQESLEKIFSSNYIKGISGVRLYRLNGNGHNHKEPIPPNLAGKIDISSITDFK